MASSDSASSREQLAVCDSCVPVVSLGLPRLYLGNF